MGLTNSKVYAVDTASKSEAKFAIKKMIEICERQKTQIENNGYQDNLDARQTAIATYTQIKKLIEKNPKIGDIVITFKDDKIEKVKFPKDLAKSALEKDASQALLLAYNTLCDMALVAAKSTSTPAFLKTATAKSTPVKTAWGQSPSISPSLTQPENLSTEQSDFLQQLLRETAGKGMTAKLDILKQDGYKQTIASLSENQFQKNILDKLFVDSKGERAMLSSQAIAHYFNCKKDFARSENDKKSYTDFASVASSKLVKSFEDLSLQYAQLAPSAPSSKIR